MSKFIWLVVGGFALAMIVGLSVLVAQTSYSYPHPTGVKLIVTRHNSVVPETTLRAREQLAQAAEQGLLPKAVVEQTEFDFGTMNPLTVASHAFVVRNEGPGPLSLQNAGTTCKCTLSKLSNGIVPPGGEAQVTLTWNSGRENAVYEHGATIVTNDPQRARIELKVRGMVRTWLDATQPELVFSSLQPDQSASQQTIVFSPSFSEFAVERASCTVEGVTWRIAPAPAEQLAELRATAAQVVTVVTPPDLPSGAFRGLLRLEIVGRVGEDAEAQRETLELPVLGNVVRRLSLYGEGIDESGLVDFGVIDEGAGKRLRFLMKVRDSQREISVKRVDVRPEFVKVSVLPYGAGDTPGMYYLDLEVPPDAPQCVHVGKRTGKLRIEFDHPRIGELELKLGVAVAPSGS